MPSRAIMERVTVLQLAAFFGTFSLAQTQFNAAYNKPIKANITCGTPAEKFFDIQEAQNTEVRTRIEQTCDANVGNNSHLASYLNDGEMGTIWISTQRNSPEKDKAFIQIDFQQMFYGYQIKLTFGNHRRPGAILISKSSDYGATFSPFHYLVSHPETTECRATFGVTHYSKSTPIDRIDRVLCQHYVLYSGLDQNETVIVDLSFQRGGDNQNTYSKQLLAWLNITNLRFSFSKMHMVLDKMSFKFNHYAVREIEVLARCNCNGHADGNTCPQNETTKRRACLCQGNTCGENCETCCPLYNQKPWKNSPNNPWINNAAACEPCNCHNHSDACTFNQTVSDLRMSLDLHGNKSGGGVCSDCKDHTRGINCERCEEFYYRPKGWNHTRQNACKACLCDARGTTKHSNLTFLDCVPDDETQMRDHPGKEPGHCYCKANVFGRQCDNCKPEYFNMTRENPAGCSECKCHLPGTVNGSNICNTSNTGQCSCKSQVEHRDCSQCKHGYFNLTNESADGCISCECDEGGTYPANSCDKVSGQCQCRQHVTGRQCTNCSDGHYYPDFHFISGKRDPYKPATNNLFTQLSIPKNGSYRFLLKTHQGVLVGSQVIFFTESNVFTNPPSCFTNKSCYLTMGNVSINVSVSSNLTKLTEIVAIPEEFFTASILGSLRRPPFTFQCSVQRNNISADKAGEELCLAGAFSLTVAFNNGCLPCACNSIGSVNHVVCQQYAGQCACKPGVEGRDCSRCKPGFYNLTKDGCKPCLCKGSNSVCHPVTGMCECPLNTVGRVCDPCQCSNNTDTCLRSGQCVGCRFNTTGNNCDICANETYGDATKQQCQACQCNSNGSLGSYCNVLTGQCMCKPQVIGRTCNTCQNRTYGFGASGCTECNCNLYGSENLNCNNKQCQCKAEATGTKCVQCNSGYYGLPLQACRACDCNVNGTLNGTVCANDTNGMCHCKPGVTGRKCDRCDKYHLNFGDQGCTACPECVQNLMKYVETTQTQVNTTSERVKTLNNLASFHSQLQTTEQSVDQTTVKSNHFYSRLSNAQTEYTKLVDDKLHSVNKSYDELLQKVNEVQKIAPVVANKTNAHVERILTVYNKTADAYAAIKSLDALIQNIVNVHTSNLRSSTEILVQTNETVTHTMVRNFSVQEKRIDQGMRDADNLTAFVRELARKLLNQTSLARDLNSKEQDSKRNLTELLASWRTAHAQFISSLDDITGQFSAVFDIMEQTQDILNNASQRHNETRDLGSQCDQVLNNTKIFLQQALSAYEQYKAMITSVSGDLKVSMLHYVEDGDQFVVKVFEGRNLSPRDLPSGTADPYIMVSLVPGEFKVQKSTIIDGTLNPKWPTKIYRFDIKLNELKKLKLKLRVFDNDPEDEDDFMGEALIDLSDVEAAKEITKWYPLRSEDVSHIESGDFKSTSGLIDVSNLLQSQINKVVPILGTLEGRLVLAHQNAQLLKRQAEEIEREFNKSSSHGAAAVQAIQRYLKIEQIINGSMEILSRAQHNILRIASQLNEVPLSKLRTNVTAELRLMSHFYNITLERNLTTNGVAHQEQAISTANSSIIQSAALWDEAFSHYPTLTGIAAKLQHAALTASDVTACLEMTRQKSNAYELSITNTSNRMTELEHNLTTILNKITFVKTAAARDSKLIQDAHALVNNASSKLNSSNLDVLAALAVNHTISGQQQVVDDNIISLEKKLDVLQARIALLELAIRMPGKDWNEYAISNRTLNSPTRNEISLTFKTNASQGLLLVLLGPKRGSNQTGIVLFLSEGKVHSQYNTGHETVTLINPVPVNTNQWVTVSLVRIGSSATLTVSTVTQQTTVSHDAGTGRQHDELVFSKGTMVYVGGAPGGQWLKVPGSFAGVLDSVVIDQFSVRLSNPKNSNNSFVFANSRTVLYYPNNGKSATFTGLQNTQQAAGEFTIHLGSFSIEFKFRTFQITGPLFVMTGKDNEALVTVSLQAGRVRLRMRLESDGNTTDVWLSSKGSSYNDGKWYAVIVNHTSPYTSLAVARNGSVDENRTDTKNTTFPSAAYVCVGFLPLNQSNHSQENTYNGDLRDLVLNSKPRLFKQMHEAVLTYGVIKGKVEPGATRFYGCEAGMSCSYVAMNTTQPTAGSIFFRLKTLQSNGILLYSNATVDGKSVHFYLALINGKLVLWSLDNTNVSLSLPFKFVVNDIMFDDNMWRTIHLNSSASGYSLYVDGTLVFNGWTSKSRIHPIQLGNPLFVGGVSKDVQLPALVGTVASFKGAMKEFKIDSREFDLSKSKSEGVHKENVRKAKPPAPPTPVPPTCAAAPGPIARSTDSSQVGFAAGSRSNPGRQSFQGFKENVVFSTKSSLFTLQVRLLTSNGLVLYIADNQTHPSRFLSLELIDNHLKYQFYTGVGHVQMNTSLDSIKTDQWLKIHLLRIINFGAILLPAQVYTNEKNGPITSTPLNLTGPLYVGGVPQHVVLHPMVTKRVGFSGCIRSLSYGSEHLDAEHTFNLGNPDISYGTSRCFSNVQSGLGFNGSAWVKFEGIGSVRHFELQLEFRTSSRDGILIYLTNDTAGQGSHSHLKLEQVSGQLVLTYRNTSGGIHQVTWKPSSSHLLCNMSWHKVKLAGVDNVLTLTVDTDQRVSLAVSPDATLLGNLFVGGVPESLTTGRSSNFVGCIRNTKLQTAVLDYGRIVDAKNTVNGCPIADSSTSFQS